MKRVAIVGHRGVGKTSLLKRISRVLAEGFFFDLDAEIEKRTGKTIHEIFIESEAAFRRHERETYFEIDNETRNSLKPVYVVFGAGFDPSLIGHEWDVWWIRRGTDSAGRIFTDRPRLNSKVTALDEYLERFADRDSRFAGRADRTLWLDEGSDDSLDSAERAYILNDIHLQGGTLTLLPDAFRSDFRSWIKLRLSWGVERIELRDDFLSTEQMQQAWETIPSIHCLVSFRARDRVGQTRELIQERRFDWPMELGSCPLNKIDILSLHHRDETESLSDALSRLTHQAATHYKAALPVRDLDELLQGYEWWKADPENRSFLPHSPDGRWWWYRRLIGRAQKLNFIREGVGSGLDQPTLLQWSREPSEPSRFAAVLGDPVQHSRTPVEHSSFFRERDALVFAIRVSEDEMLNGALARLQGLGLRWAAVTAPLKTQAFEACSQVSSIARELKSVNTLEWTGEFWRGTNTDYEGLSRALDGFELGRVAVWGGGGTLNVVKKCLPNARLFSLRTGEDREDGTRAEDFMPETVLWAVGRSRSEVREPPASWRPRLTIDLNYAEDSPGRAFAVERGSRYISGLKMFRAQAEAQRRYWQEAGE